MEEEFTRTQVPYCQIPDDWLVDFSQCLHEWQSLIAGILALAAACGTILIIRCQINQAKNQHTDHINRRHQAVRTIAPLMLAQFSSYIDDLISYFIYCYSLSDRTEDTEAFRSNAEKFNPDFPHNATQHIRDFVETLTDQNAVKHIAELISSLQILDARTLKSSRRLDSSKASNIENIILCGKAKLLIDRIFDYSRFVDESEFTIFPTDNLENPWNAIRKSTHGLLFHRQNRCDLEVSIQKTIDRKISDGKNPWLEKMNP